MQLAWKELKKNKGKYSLITTILVMLIFMVLFLSGLANGLSRATSALIEEADAHYYIVSEDSDGLITRSNVTYEQMEQLKTMTTDELTGMNLTRMTVYTKDSESKLDLTYLAVNAEEFMMPVMSKGDKSTLDTISSWIVLDESYQSEGINIGDTIIDSTTKLEMEVAGFIKDGTYAHSPIGVVSHETYTTLRTEINKSYEAAYHAIAVSKEDVAQIQLDGLIVLNKADIIKSIPGHAQEQMTIQMILWVLVVVSAAILGVFFYVITIQKTSQFGVLKAIGMSMKSLSAMVISQVVILSGFSMIVGNALTFLMAAVLPSAMPFSLNISRAIVVSVIYVVISILCSLISLIKIAKVDPLITIGGNE